MVSVVTRTPRHLLPPLDFSDPVYSTLPRCLRNRELEEEEWSPEPERLVGSSQGGRCHSYLGLPQWKTGVRSRSRVLRKVKEEPKDSD